MKAIGLSALFVCAFWASAILAGNKGEVFTQMNRDIENNVYSEMNGQYSVQYQGTDRLILYTPIEGYEKKIRVPASVVPPQFENKKEPGKLLQW